MTTPRAGKSRLDVDLGERESLKSLGKYLHTTSQGLAILKLEVIPPIGARVTDREGHLLGQVADIFGPITSPYCSIRLLEVRPTRLTSAGAELYISESKQASKSGKHGRH